MSSADPRLQPFCTIGAIDLTAFVGSWPWRLAAQSDAGALGVLADRLGLNALCVSHLAAVFGFDTRTGNEALCAQTGRDDRLLPFAVLNPSTPGWEHELEMLRSAGAVGVRLTPGYHGYRLTDPAVVDALTGLAELGLPLQICVRLDDPRLRHPRFRAEDVPLHELVAVIRSRPERPLVLSGLRTTEWDTVQAHLGPVVDPVGVLVDLWYVNGPTGVIERICADAESSRYGFASGAPIQTPEATALQLAAADITTAQRARLGRENARHFLAPSDGSRSERK